MPTPADQVNQTPDRVLYVLIALALVTAFTSGLTLELAGATVTLAYLVTLVLLGYLLLYAGLTHRRVAVLFRDDFSFLLYAFVASNIISSLLLSNDRWYSLRGCVPLIACVLLYTGVRSGLRVLRQDPAHTVTLFTGLNLMSAGTGLACLLAIVITGRENFGVTLGHLAIGMQTLMGQVPPSIRSLATEPNLFAIATGTLLCISLGKYLLGDRSESKLLWLGLPAMAILFAFTRSVYGGLVIVLLVLMIYAGQTRAIYRVAMVSAVAVLVFLAVFFSLPDEHPTRKAISERMATLLDFKGGTGGGRWAGYQVAWVSYLNHPVLGNGTLSAETTVYNPYTGEYQERMGAPGWLTGSGLQALHDTGIVGLLILLGMFGVLMLKTHRLFRKLDKYDPRRGVLLGFLGGNLLLFISSQLSSPLWTAFPYVWWAAHMEYLVACHESGPSIHEEPASR